MWHVRMEELTTARLRSLQGASAEKEYQCKKIVALCTGIPIDNVEEVSLYPIVSVDYRFTHLLRCLRIWWLPLKVRLKSLTLAAYLGSCKRFVLN
jgi:hypothetical protein